MRQHPNLTAAYLLGGLFILAGCGTATGPVTSTSPGSGSSGGPGSGSGSGPSGGTSSLATPSVYIASDTHSPSDDILTFATTATGSATITADIPGSNVSVDDNGNIYVLAKGNTTLISVYAQASPTGTPMRSLTIGSATNVSTVVDVTASATGEIFVSDATGISVFDAAATGSATPVRHIVGNIPNEGEANAITAGVIAVDRADNVYIVDKDDSIAVFGPTDTGTVVPKRVISGPLTRLTGTGKNLIYSMATDAAGNLYVSCLCVNAANTGNEFDIFEYSPTAAGNVSPIRFVSDPTIYSNSGGNGIAVDAAGTIYVSSSTDKGIQTVYEFASSFSGSGAATNTVTLGGWYDSPSSRIAVH